MSYNLQKKKLGRRLLVGGAICLVTCGVFSSCTDGYDLDEKNNPNLGSSIYNYLQDEGNFTNYLKLIDDLGETEMLSHTGSKTIFAANDEAFEKFFKNNTWGVNSYSDLSNSKKKLLLYSSIIDNPLQLQNLSSVQGPLDGYAMRRTTSSGIYDSVLVVSTADPQIPDNKYWATIKQTQDKIVLMKDGSSSSPMLHFVQKFLDQKLFTNEDVDFLYNSPVGTRQTGDAYVNDAKISNGNVSCQNGFIHEVDKVIVPLDNMAEIIRTNGSTTQFSQLMERFAVPYWDKNVTDEYNRIYGTSYDSVYQKRYFSKARDNGGRSLQEDQHGNAASAVLKYDPGWNSYYPDAQSDRNPVMEDMGVILAPSDSAMNDWWNNGGGTVIKDYYGSWDKVPDKVIATMLNNSMLISFTSSVPSKFGDVINDASLPMGITTSDVDKVILGCNGAVYLTNKVFTPATYSSVVFPALINETMNIIYNAVMDETNKFYAYLNSMDATYSFFIPTNNGLLTYVDPVSLGQTTTHLWKFHYDPTVKEVARVYADVFEYNQTSDGTWVIGDSVSRIKTSATATAMNTQLCNRLADIIDNSTVIGDVEDGGTYYQTKGRSTVRVDGSIGVEGKMSVSGGWQLETNQPLTISRIYDMSGKTTGIGNGKSYIVDTAPVMTARRSVADILSENPDFSDFLQVLKDAGALSTSVATKYVSGGWSSVSPIGNLIYIPTQTGEGVNYLFNNYHYTVYCPTNEAMRLAYEAGLPDTTAIRLAEESGDEDSLYHVRQVLLNFVKYHIQDRSIYIDKNSEGGNFETDKSDPSSGRFYKVGVEVDGSNLTVTDKMGTAHKVDKNKMYNVMAREYWLNSATASKATTIDNSSFAVLHAVNEPLLYSKNQFIYQKVEIADEEEESAESKLRVFRR